MIEGSILNCTSKESWEINPLPVFILRQTDGCDASHKVELATVARMPESHKTMAGCPDIVWRIPVTAVHHVVAWVIIYDS